MNMLFKVTLAGIAFALCPNVSAQAQSAFSPKIFWENNMEKGVVLISPTEMILMDSMGVKYGKVLAKDKVGNVFMSPDGKKLIYTAASGIWLVKIENGETQLVSIGDCGYLRWNSDSSSFLFTTSDYKNASTGINVKLFWADGDGKNTKQVYP